MFIFPKELDEKVILLKERILCIEKLVLKEEKCTKSLVASPDLREDKFPRQIPVLQ